MTSVDDSQLNLLKIKNAIDKLPPDTRLLCLPENSLYLNLTKSPIPKSEAFTQDSPVIQELQTIAKDKSLNIHLGGIPWWKGERVVNEALLISEKGEVIETYEKIHLFDVNLGPGIEISESKSYSPGSRLNTFEIDGWKIATTICYDLRFPEIFLQYMEQDNVDLFLVPAAFTTKTGAIHWKPLLMGRAIECQAYVVAVAQVGYHRDLKREKLRKSWGPSLVIDPWGRTLQESPSYKAFLDLDITEHEPMNVILEREKILEYRKAIPVKNHRHFKLELKPK